jgi:hypothetical protein
LVRGAVIHAVADRHLEYDEGDETEDGAGDVRSQKVVVGRLE